MNFKTYKNILNKNEKINLFKFVKKELKDLGETFPGLQTECYLHERKEMKDFVEKINKYIKPYKIFKCWGVLSEGKEIYWHNHIGYKYSFVYYLKNPEKAGTMFLNLKKRENHDFISYSKGEENSLLKFDSSLYHSTPNTHKKIKRYTIAFDVI